MESGRPMPITAKKPCAACVLYCTTSSPNGWRLWKRACRSDVRAGLNSVGGVVLVVARKFASDYTCGFLYGRKYRHGTCRPLQWAWHRGVVFNAPAFWQFERLSCNCEQRGE